MSEIIPVETINPATATAPAVRVFRMNQKKNNAGYPIPQPKLSLPKKCCRIIHKNLGWSIFIFAILVAAIISIAIGVLANF